MATYEDAHQLARQYKNAGVSRTELEALASRYENEGKYSSAAAFQAVAGE